MAFDKTDVLPLTSRFVVVDDYDIKGGGIVLEALEDSQTRVRDQVFLRENRWEKSLVGAEHRAERYNQKATLLLVTGPARSPRKEIAKALERRLFEEGKLVYFLAFGSVRYGVDADITRSDAPRSEPELMRRLGEVAHILVDAGLILVVSAQALSTEDLEVFKTTVDPERILVAWAGEPGPEGLPVDLDLGAAPEAEAVDRLKTLLQERGAIFRPW